MNLKIYFEGGIPNYDLFMAEMECFLSICQTNGATFNTCFVNAQTMSKILSIYNNYHKSNFSLKEFIDANKNTILGIEFIEVSDTEVPEEWLYFENLEIP